MAVRPAAWAAVVVNYESGPVLLDCVRSLRADQSAGPMDIVVVDNGSTDGSIDALRAADPDVAVLQPGANLGYGRAANLGIAVTTTPVVAVVNPDAFVAPGSARVVVDAFAVDADLGVIGPRIVNPDGSVYPSARIAPGVVVATGHALLGGVFPHNRFTTRYRALDADPDRARDVDWVSGAALWFRREFLDRVGGWDERYFMFLEDVDVCREVRRHGGRVRFEPGAEVIHVVGTSREGAPIRSIVRHHRSAYRYVDKWWTGPQRLALPLAATFLAGRGAVAAVASGLRSSRSARRPKISTASG